MTGLRAYFILIAAIVLSVQAKCLWANDASNDPHLLKRILSGLAETGLKQAVFTETKTSSLLEDPVTLEGELQFRPPAYLLKKIIKPFSEKFEVINGEVHLQRKDEEERVFSVEEHPVINSFVSAFVSILGGDEKGLEKYYRYNVRGSYADWVISLEPKLNKMKEYVSKLNFYGKQADVVKIEIIEANDDRSLMIIKTIK